MSRSRAARPVVLAAGVACLVAANASAQTFATSPARVPANTGFTENADFGDLDLDGDADCVLAEGGSFGDDRNDLWINRGHEPGGTVGTFADRTASQFPSVLDQSRDVDLADFDLDGDLDLEISNTSAIVSQSNRWWVNMGGAQGGTAGFFQDQTSTRWLHVGSNNGSSHVSSVAGALVLAGGGFVDWSCDSALGDLDGDGDPDLLQASYGPAFSGTAPSRLFLNDGSGRFEEFNPSTVQLLASAIGVGTPALWCEGTQAHDTTNSTGAHADIALTALGLDLGDFDGDLDVDALHGSRNELPRLFRNRMTDAGAFVAFRDTTDSSGHFPFVTGVGHYEQEAGDLDSDGDLDVYGINWEQSTGAYTDLALLNDGAAGLGSPLAPPASSADDNDGDFLDFDNDGRLDVLVVSTTRQDRLYRNTGAPGALLADVTAAQMPAYSSMSLGGDSSDVDADGDYDFLVTADQDEPEVLLENLSQVPDTTAPRPGRLEQAPDRAAGPAPTRIRVHVYDNSSWDVARYDVVTLEHSWNGGLEWRSAPMSFSGGQLFRGEIRGDLAGTIQYRVRAVDEHGNAGLSAAKSFQSSGCTGNVFSHCTPGTTSIGCTATMSASGAPSISAASGFVLTASCVDGQRTGLIFYGTGGRKTAPWGAGTSFLCVKSPTQRTPLASSGGTSGACDGSLSLDWLAFLAANPGALGSPFSAGQTVDVQCWFRDPPAPEGTSLSDALEFTTCP